MLKFNYSSGLYEYMLYQNAVNEEGEIENNYSDSDNNGYWAGFMNRWYGSADIFNNRVVPTEEQNERLLEVNRLGTSEERSHYVEEASLFVEFGAVHPESNCPFLMGRKSDAVVRQNYVNSILGVKLNELAGYRFKVEVSGIDLNGMTIKTDRESQSQINNTFSSMKNGLVETTDWKTKDGWIIIGQDELEPIARAVAIHVKKCFGTEKIVSEKLESITDWEELLSFGIQYEFDKEFNKL